MERGARLIATLELAPTVRHKLQATGFRNVGDLRGCGPIDLAREAGITHQEALFVLKVAFSADHGDEGIAGAISAEQVYAEEQASRGIVTFCEKVDRMLGGGIPARAITEFCGVPGVGKTQLGMQIAVDAQIPECMGGLQGEAVYIDTEGSFMMERLLDITDAVVDHVHNLGRRATSEECKTQAERFSRESVLHGIHYFRVHDAAEQIAVTNTLPQFMDNHPKVCAIIVDSITFQFRQGFQDMAQRTRLLAQMAQQLMQLAESKGIAVVLINQVTTKVRQERTGGGGSRLVPALGDSWAHAATSRVILFWHEGQRFAHLHKSPSRPSTTVPYAVTAAGIRDVAPAPPPSLHQQAPREEQRHEERELPSGRGQKREWGPTLD
uniref:DNA repair protein RAD51 homolog 3 n=2 Tax=Tetraselmis chuii TaxID=63592 RepID=A0A7S1SLP5_9CHLO|mmetsp:Transcript_18752/g.33480  ORF Transcript_18752/g.33480 Transcript_18752/m.33480 type:complete len:381 (+) Transcript_18752:255-1397(+)